GDENEDSPAGVSTPQASEVGRRSDRDGHLPSDVPGFEVPDGLGNIRQRVGPVDDRSHLAGFDELAQTLHVAVTLLRSEHGEPLADERGEHHRSDLPAEASSPPAPLLSTHDDEGSLRSERTPKPREPTVATKVETQVVARVAVGEVLESVVNDVIGTDRADEIDLGGAAHPGDFCAEGLGELHGI